MNNMKTAGKKPVAFIIPFFQIFTVAGLAAGLATG
jgi:hypothetical protein